MYGYILKFNNDGFHRRNGGFLKNGTAVSYARTAGTREPEYSNSLINKLQEVFGKVFSYDHLCSASDDIDYHLNENPDIFRRRAWEKQYEQAQEKALNRPQPAKKRSRDMER